MGIVELKNDRIAIGVNTHGAELVSLKSNETDREYMWCGDAVYWGKSFSGAVSICRKA